MRKRSGTYFGSAVFILLLLLGGLFIVATDTVSAEQDGDFIFEVSGSPAVATITGYTGAGGAVAIPSTLGGNAMVAIGYKAFYNCTSLTTVSIPDSVTSIGDWAFQACTSLTSVFMPDSVTSIGTGAFFHCFSLTSVMISSNISSIRDFTFAGCTYLDSLTIPNSVTSIGDYAFSYCRSLTSMTIPNNVTSVEHASFEYCTSLTSITMGTNVSSIGSYAFQSCSDLTSITFQGLVAPTVYENWTRGTSTSIRGYANAASNFPAPGEVFNGLTMGSVTPVAPISDSAILLFIVEVIAVTLVLVSALFFRKRKKTIPPNPSPPRQPASEDIPRITHCEYCGMETSADSGICHYCGTMIRR
jgi:hypothetical protein